MNRLATAALCICLAGCETLTAIQSKPGVQFAEAAALKLAQSYFSNGGNADTAWGISQGLNLLGDATQFAIAQKRANSEAEAQALAAAKVKAQVQAFANDQTAVRALSTELAKLIPQSGATTPEAQAKITLAIAAGIQKAARSASNP